MTRPVSQYLNQHLVNPENCLRCSSCERVCPTGAISHDVNVVIDPDKCAACQECVEQCPTGAIDSWRVVPRADVYTLERQHRWTALPPPLGIPAALIDPSLTAARSPSDRSIVPPPSAPKPALNRFPLEAPARARVRSNRRVTAPDGATDVRHIVLQVEGATFPYVEGQTVGISPPGLTESGEPHGMRLYSIASARDGDGAEDGTLALTVKRVVRDQAGRMVPGVASNHLCDLAPGDAVRLTGPYGGAFLMPDEPAAKLLMIATGTGVAPMRAMIQRRLRRGELDADSAMLFYGARGPADMPYHDELVALTPDRLDLHLAFSRTPPGPRRLVQNALVEQRERVVALLRDPQCHLFLCGLRRMEHDVLAHLHRICMAAHIDWPSLRVALRSGGRLQIETY